MNPLTSIPGTIISGFVLAIVIVFALGPTGVNALEIAVWAHVLVGITWIGLLYYFNFVQIPAVGAALKDQGGPGPAGINKYVAPRALLWFRWAAVATWLTGAAALGYLPGAAALGHMGILKAAFTFEGFSFATSISVIGIGAWLGTIMLFNVWVLIWPNQQKILGMKQASPEEIAAAKKIALMASRTNTLLSIPMLMCMTAFAHNLPF